MATSLRWGIAPPRLPTSYSSRSVSTLLRTKPATLSYQNQLYRPSPLRLITHSRARWSSTSTTSTYQHITLSKDQLPNDQGCVATVALSNPTKLNIASSATLIELKAALATLQYDTSIRVVILTAQRSPSSTPSFCGGADIRELRSLSTPSAARAFITQIHDVCEALRNQHAMTIARIDGVCLGAGLEMAAACDFRYGTARSTFAMPEVAIGIPSVVHARSLVNIMGWQKAKRLMAFAEVWSAADAEAAGLLDKKVETTQELDETLQRDVEVLASHGRKGMHAQKMLFKAWEELDFHAGLRVSVDAFAQSYADGGKEPRGFMDAWIEKKKKR